MIAAAKIVRHQIRALHSPQQPRRRFPAKSGAFDLGLLICVQVSRFPLLIATVLCFDSPPYTGFELSAQHSSESVP